MDNFIYVNLLYKKESELINICKYNNLSDYDSRDIIQNLYVKLLTFENINKYVDDKGEVNMFIIFMILRNMILNFRKRESWYSNNEFFESEDIIDEQYEEPEDRYNIIVTEISKMSDTENWFDKKILELYIYNKHTIRSLAKETTIGMHTIQPIVHEFKMHCQKLIKAKQSV